MTKSLRRHGFVIAGLAAILFLLIGIAGVRAFRHFSRYGPLNPTLVAVERQDDWKAFGGTWQFVNGTMRNNSDERGSMLMNGSTSWTDYIVEADVLLLGPYGFAGLTIRASDEEEGVDAYHGYTAGLSDLDNSLFLGRADYGWRGFLDKTISPRVYDQQWYHLKLLAYHCVLAVSATGPSGQAASATVEDRDCIHSGRFGLKSYNTGAEWRNVNARPATQEDLIAMIGDMQPPLAVSMQSPAGSDAATNDRFFEPIHRDLLQNRSDINAQPIGSLRHLSPNIPQLVIVHGVVTLTSPVLFVQDSTGGLAIPGGHEEVPLEIGDEIEAKGDVELHDFSPVLRNASVRMLWSHTPVPPISVIASEAATGSFDARFVEVQGRLVEMRTDSGGHPMFTLDEGSQTFLAIISQTGSAAKFRDLKAMSRLRLRGICVVDPVYTHNLTPFAVLLPSYNDVEVIEGPPWWRNAGHIIMLIIGLLLLTLAGLVFYILIERWRFQAVIEEREHLAYEMHDTLAQSFAGIGFQLEAIHDEAGEDPRMIPLIKRAREMVRNSREEAHRDIAALHPEHIESVGLLFALEDSARRLMNRDSSIAIKTISVGDERALPLRISDTLFRIGQEAIANAITHAHPATLTLCLSYRKSSLELIVADDGCGFLVSSESAGFGIRGMSKRAETISAQFTLDSVPGEGTAVHIVIPLKPSFLMAYWQHILWPLARRKQVNERTEV
jgi:signal transduction histidine kinase